MTESMEDLVRAVVRDELSRLGYGAVERRGISVRQAAERLDVDQVTIRRLISGGRLRAVRIGDKSVRVIESDVSAMLDADSEGVA